MLGGFQKKAVVEFVTGENKGKTTEAREKEQKTLLWRRENISEKGKNVRERGTNC